VRCGILKFPLLSSCLSKAQLRVSVVLASQYKLSESGQTILSNTVNAVDDNENSAWVNQGLIRAGCGEGRLLVHAAGVWLVSRLAAATR